MKDDMRRIVEEGFEKGEYAKTFTMNDKPTLVQEKFLKKFLLLMPDNPKVLDLGSGTGLPFDRFLVLRGCKVTGIDISKKHIYLSRRNVPGAKFMRGDFTKIDFNETFDGIISLHSIFHVPKEEHYDLIVKIRDHLEEQGTVLLTFGTGGDYVELDNWYGARMAWSSHEPEEYDQLMKKAGFRVLETFLEGKPGEQESHYWVLAQKE